MSDTTVANYKWIVIAGACRTPIGSMGGSLGTISAMDLGGTVIKEVLQQTEIIGKDVDHVYMGNVI